MEANREVTEPQDQPTGDVKISAPDPDDEGGDDGGDGGGDAAPAQAARDQQRPPGNTRKGNRGNWKATRDINEKLTEASRRIVDMQASHQRDMADIRERLTGATRLPPPQASAGAAPSAHEQQLETIYSAQAAEMKAFRAHDPRDGDYNLTKYNQLSRQARALENRIDMDNYFRERGVDPNSRQPAQRQQDPRQIAQQVELQTIANTVRNEFPWLREPGGRGDGARAAMARMVEALIVSSGGQNTVEIHREAAALVERRMGFTPSRRGPNPGQERRYASVGDDNRGAPHGSAPREVSVPAEMLEGSGLPMDKIRRAIFRPGRE